MHTSLPLTNSTKISLSLSHTQLRVNLNQLPPPGPSQVNPGLQPGSATQIGIIFHAYNDSDPFVMNPAVMEPEGVRGRSLGQIFEYDVSPTTSELLPSIQRLTKSSPAPHAQQP